MHNVDDDELTCRHATRKTQTLDCAPGEAWRQGLNEQFCSLAYLPNLVSKHFFMVEECLKSRSVVKFSHLGLLWQHFRFLIQVSNCPVRLNISFRGQIYYFLFCNFRICKSDISNKSGIWNIKQLLFVWLTVNKSAS